MAGGAAVDGGMSGLLRDMGRDAGLAQIADEFGGVIALVRAQRQPLGRAGGMAVDHVERGLPFGMAIGPGQLALHDQAGAVLHQRMAYEAQHGTGAGGFLIKPRLGIGGRGMGGIRALLATEVDLGIAVSAGGAGHRGGLGRCRFRVIFDRAIRAGRATAVIVGRRALRLRLEALHRRPGLHQGAIDREMLVRQERRHLSMGKDRGHDLARHLGAQQPVAVLREHRRNPHSVVDAQPDEPAKQQVVIHLLHQLAFRADREQDLQKARPDQPFRRDRGAAEADVKPFEISVEAGEGFVDHLPDLAQRMLGGDPFLEVHIAEKRPARLVRPPHRAPLSPWERMNHVLRPRSRPTNSAPC